MLSHSEHPEREQLFIEIAFTHNCTEEKISSGIQIIEIKVKDDNDFSMPFDEQEMMFLDFSSNNPYTFNDMPSVRFYNFRRQEKYSIPLTSFVVAKTEQGDSVGLSVSEKINCQDLDRYHVSTADLVDYILATSDNILNDYNKNKLYAFGLAMAINKGYPIQHCMFCRKHYKGQGGCIIPVDKVYTDERSGRHYKRSVRVYTHDLDPKKFDRTKLALGCRKFILNRTTVQDTLNTYKDIPYWEWENNKNK